MIPGGEPRPARRPDHPADLRHHRRGLERVRPAAAAAPARSPDADQGTFARLWPTPCSPAGPRLRHNRSSKCNVSWILLNQPPNGNPLRQTLGAQRLSIQEARLHAQIFREKLESGLFGNRPEDISASSSGPYKLGMSLPTAATRISWTVLIDGLANRKHLDLARQVKGTGSPALKPRSLGWKVDLGNMAFSHEIIHQIGGEDDTNSNTTRRILLILESLPIGRREAFDRVLDHVLGRYIAEDARFLQPTARYHVPRFLLNDFARYWRTMAIDFAYKRRMRDGTGTSIRNIKLRMSRKVDLRLRVIGVLFLSYFAWQRGTISHVSVS